jgi:hypothetical protein
MFIVFSVYESGRSMFKQNEDKMSRQGVARARLTCRSVSLLSGSQHEASSSGLPSSDDLNRSDDAATHPRLG